MKKILYSGLISIGLAIQTSYAQKLDLDKEYWDMSYIKLPTNNSTSSLNTYSAVVYGEASNLNRVGLTSDKIESAVKLNGYVYTAESADIEIEVNVDNFRVISETIESKDVSEKDQAGNAVTKKVFYSVSRYITPTTIKIVMAGDKAILVDMILANNQNPVVIESNSYPNYDAANAYLKGSGDKRMDSFKAKYTDMFTGVFNDFKQRHDFTVRKETEIFWHVDLKKDPSFAEFDAKLVAAKEVFNAQNVYEDIKITRDKLIPFMQYLRDNADKTVAEDKKGRKLKYAYLINLARTQLWLEMLDESETTAKQIIENDYDKLDGKNLLLSVKYFREELRMSPSGSRHFMRDGFTSTAQYKAYDIQPKVIPFKYPKPPVGYKAYPGYVINYSKEKIKGQLWVKDLESSVCFQTSEGTKFVYEEDKELKEMTIDIKTIDEISLGRDDSFQRINFKNNLGMKESSLFFRVLFENDNYKLLKYYSMANDIGGGLKNTIASTKLTSSGDMCIMNKSTAIIAPVGSIIPKNAAENTAAYYEGCAEIKNKLLVQEFGNMNNLQSQIKAIEFFQTKCGK